MKYLLIALLLAAATLFYMGGRVDGAGVQSRRDVYAVCNASRLSPTISEQQCGDLQNSTNTEFLCTNNNNRTDNVCWVESK